MLGAPFLATDLVSNTVLLLECFLMYFGSMIQSSSLSMFFPCHIFHANALNAFRRVVYRSAVCLDRVWRASIAALSAGPGPPLKYVLKNFDSTIQFSSPSMFFLSVIF